MNYKMAKETLSLKPDLKKRKYKNLKMLDMMHKYQQCKQEKVMKKKLKNAKSIY